MTLWQGVRNPIYIKPKPGEIIRVHNHVFVVRARRTGREQTAVFDAKKEMLGEIWPTEDLVVHNTFRGGVFATRSDGSTVFVLKEHFWKPKR